MDFLSQGIPLGRWFGIRVVISWFFFIAVWWILQQFQDNIGLGILCIILLFGTVLLHEFGHALACLGMGGEAHLIVLGPLGGVAYVQPPNNVWAWLVTTVCGPLVNAVLWPLFWVATTYGLPALAKVMNPESTAFQVIGMTCIFMMMINKGLLLFNLIPAYPMDGGRLLQQLLWLTIGYQKSLQIAGMVGTVAGGGLIVLGVGMHRIHIPYVNYTIGGEQNFFLMAIGLMCAMQSFEIYKRSQEIAGWRKN
jgi:Zn-dependent protease